MARGTRAESVTVTDSNGLSPEDFLRHYRAIEDTKRVKDEAARDHPLCRVVWSGNWDAS